jgi:hypothetical protein
VVNSGIGKFKVKAKTEEVKIKKKKIRCKSVTINKKGMVRVGKKFKNINTANFHYK